MGGPGIAWLDQTISHCVDIVWKPSLKGRFLFLFPRRGGWGGGGVGVIQTKSLKPIRAGL